MDSKDGVLSLKDNIFTSQGIVDAAANNVMLSLGVLFITIDSYLSEIGFKNDPKNLTEMGMYRSLMYMLRSAFAHDMLVPKWNVRGPYADVIFDINLGHAKIEGSLSELDGKVFNEIHIGGHRNIIALISSGTILISRLKNV